MEKIIIECECGSHLLQVSSDSEDNTFYFAMYSYGGSHIYGLARRLKAAWKMITTGKMFSDQIILNHGEAMRLRSFLES